MQRHFFKPRNYFRVCFYHSSTRPILPSKFISILRKETKDPIYSLLESVHASPRVLAELSSSNTALTNVSKWKPVARAGDIDLALAQLPEKNWSQHIGDIPTWLVLYLAAFKIRTATHAKGSLVELVTSFTTVDSTNPDGYSAPLIILASIHLARFGHLLPLSQFSRTFFELPLPASSTTSLYFNLLLLSLTEGPISSSQRAALILDVLKRMEGRQIKVHDSSYLKLLSDRHVALELTTYLRDRMQRQGFVPSREHLEAQLRIASNARDSQAIRTIIDALNHLSSVNRKGADWYSEHKPLLRADVPSGNLKGHVRHRKQYADVSHAPRIRGYRNKDDAFNFLRKLLKLEEHAVDSKEHVAGALDLHHRKSRALSTPSYATPSKFRVDIHEFTAALQVAARSSDMSSQDLLASFEKAQTLSRAFRPTTVTYNALLLGLTRRNDFERAMEVFGRLMESGLPLDKTSLHLGLVSLVELGFIRNAIRILGRYTGLLVDIEGGTPMPRTIPVDTQFMNGLLQALRRHRRPDVVFRIWDGLTILFRCQPDEATLCILLRSARLARSLDDSFTGTMAYFSLQNPFRSSPPDALFRTGKRNQTEHLYIRQELYRGITGVLGHSDDDTPTKPYTNGIWHGRLPLDAAAEIFVRAIFGQAISQGGQPLYKQLLETVAAAHPVRKPNGDPSWFGPRPLPAFLPPQDLFAPDGQSWLPGVKLTDSGFLQYILLLGAGAGHGKAEVPRALAWMKCLRIMPSKDTLAASMVLFSEVSMSPINITDVSLDGTPQDGRRAVGHLSQYELFVRWLRQWVKAKEMPSNDLLGLWVRRIESRQYDKW